MNDIFSRAKETLQLADIAVMIAVFAVGAVLLFVRPRWGRRWLVTAVVGYWFLSSPLGSNLFIAPLVRGFHSIETPQEATGAGAIVVLGGGIRAIKARSDSLSYPYDSTALRVLEAARVFRLLDGRPIVIASGGVTNFVKQTSEGVLIAEALSALRVPGDSIVVDAVSMNTYEQAINVTRLLRARGIHRFVLVTSPTHMRRAAAVFRAQHADIIPSVSAKKPERLRRPAFFLPDDDALDVSDDAVYDYAGLVYYWSRGRFQPVPTVTAP